MTSHPLPMMYNVEKYENKYALYELTQVKKEAVPKTVCE
jgi:hypothetical protein